MNPTPMLLSEYKHHKTRINSQEYVYIQPKLNGWRALINTKTGQIVSREGNLIDTLPHISKAAKSFSDRELWLDCELYAHGFSLGQIQSMIKKGDKRVLAYVFDVVLDNTKFGERVSFNVPRLYNSKYLVNIETRQIEPSEVEFIYQHYLESGYEGAVIRLDTPYEQKRSTNIFKLKPDEVNSVLDEVLGL